MKLYATITVIGRDQSGVIARVTSFLFVQKANIEGLEEKVTRGQFGMTVQASWSANECSVPAASGFVQTANASWVDLTDGGATSLHSHTNDHARQHSITSTSDHTSTATSGQMLQADANGLPVNATNTDAQVSAAVTASHAAVTVAVSVN